MKKQNNLKIIAFAVFVFVMAQGCIPTTPSGGNPTPNNLTGKLKYFNFKANGINADIFISYSSNGLVSKLNTTDVSGFPIANIVEYEPNKVIIKDSVNTTTGDVYYLKPGTILIDSICYYNDGNFNGKTKIDRDANNNLIRISMNDVIVKDSFVYSNNNIVSYLDHGFDPFFNTNYVIKTEFEYDFTKTLKSNININLILSNALSQNIDILGINLGNISQHPISKIKNTTIIGTTIPNSIKNFTYTSYTNNLVEYNMTLSLQNLTDTAFFISNKYY